MANPKISVLMTVRNAERFVSEAIESMLGQTFGDFEFIIVDNASTDRTRDIINSYSDRRIILIENKEDLGQTRSLNAGISKCRSELIARMDADDISLPNRLEEQYSFLRWNTNIAVVGSWYVEIDENGKVIREFRLPTDPLQIKIYLTGCSDLSYHCIPHPIVLMRKKALLECGQYDERYISQDFDLWVRISRKFLLSNLKRVLFKYRINKDSQSSKSAAIFRGDCRNIIEGNIRYFWPDIKENDFLVLARMLEFLHQTGRGEGESVFRVFGEFLSRVIPGCESHRPARIAAERMKLFYIPKLMSYDRLFCLKYLAKQLFCHPARVGSKKFYGKIYKTVMMNSGG